MNGKRPLQDIFGGLAVSLWPIYSDYLVQKILSNKTFYGFRKGNTVVVALGLHPCWGATTESWASRWLLEIWFRITRNFPQWSSRICKAGFRSMPGS